jgi:hypothetical protein
VFFKYKEAADAQQVIRLSGNMHKYADVKDWIAGPSLVRDLQVADVQALLAKLTPEDAMVSFINQVCGRCQPHPRSD